ncbi:MAG: leucine-rich repeat domain-containing protein [Candidatus Thorarchaeota archaeon]
MSKIRIQAIKTFGENIEIVMDTSANALSVAESGIESIDLSELRKVPSLKRLSLYRNALRELDLTPLTYCANLAQIDAAYNRIEKISLEPIRNLANLRELRLESNLLRRIDLGPLESCPLLTVITVGTNRLASINLSPLKGCDRLREISLAKNLIASIDLTPLRDKNQLRILELHENRLTSIDLSPLKECRYLLRLTLAGNRLTTLDLAPLDSNEGAKVIDVSHNSLQELVLPCSNVLRSISAAHNKLNTIDLTPLGIGTNVEIIELSDNQLTQIDLRPLANCPRLKRLILSRNQMREIDLSPLVDCQALNEVRIDGNHLQEIDFRPLSHATKLRLIEVSQNELTSLDLSPLARASNLTEIGLEKTGVKALDILPLFACASLEKLKIDRGTRLRTIYIPEFIEWPKGIQAHKSKLKRLVKFRFKVQEWGFFVNRAIAFCDNVQNETERIAFQAHILRLLGLEEFSMLDINLSQYLKLIKNANSLQEAKTHLRELLFEPLETQVTHGGPTHFVNTELLAREPATKKLADAIEQLRDKEMTIAYAKEEEGKIDLRPLWLTYVGYRRLKRLGVSLDIAPDKFESVKKAFSAIGYEIKLLKTSPSNTLPKMSAGMREFLLTSFEKKEEGGEKSPTHKRE